MTPRTHSVDAILRGMGLTAWAILPEKLAEIEAFLAFRAAGGEYSAAEIEARTRPRREAPKPNGAVAVIPVFGTISRRMTGLEAFSGGTSSEAIAREFDAAVRDPEVGSIVLAIDSPGGAVAGIPELAARIRAARGQKRIVAVADTLMASAAYWIASAADEIVASPSAEVGSIGVLAIHTDRTGADAKAGYERTIIREPAHKAEGNPFEPLSEEARDHIQGMVREAYDSFVNAVATGRGVSAAVVRSSYGEGRVLSAERAREAGMVDRIATLDEVIDELTGKTSQRSASGGRQAVAPAAAVVTPPAPAATTETPRTQPASEARSTQMDEEQNTAPGGAAAVATPPAATSSRETQLAELAASHNMSDRLAGWIVEGKSVDQVRDEIMAHYKAGAKPIDIRVGNDRAAGRPWESFGAMLSAVHQAATNSFGGVDARLNASASGMSQGSPSDGGFLVPVQFSQRIWDGLNDTPDAILPMTDNYTVDGESIEFNANAEKSRANGSRYGGVQGYWLAEAGTMTPSAPKFRKLRLEPQEMGVLVYATDKLLRNSPTALDQYVSRAATEEINFMTGDSLFNGDGVGKPKGYLKSGAKVTVAKETNQAAGTLLAQNLSKMWSRLHPRLRAGAAWFVNVDVEPALDALFHAVKNVAGSENVGGFASSLYNPEKNTIKGRPIIPVEYCSTLGTEGDIVLANWGAYATGTRGSGIESAVSMHVRYLQREQAFRFVFEVDGQSWLADALSPKNGANTLSSIVTLATRA